jgi:hypothetical protein
MKIRKHSFPDETENVGVDFDGVVHLCSRGFYDGTIYDPPVLGSKDALQRLSEKYRVIIFSAKARHDRPLIDGKTGIQLIWEWLEKHDMAKYVSDVTAEKPRAVFYIDDKALRFHNWSETFEQIGSIYGDI